MVLIPVLERQSQANCEFKASLIFTGCSRNASQSYRSRAGSTVKPEGLQTRMKGRGQGRRPQGGRGNTNGSNMSHINARMGHRALSTMSKSWTTELHPSPNAIVIFTDARKRPRGCEVCPLSRRLSLLHSGLNR